MGVETHVDPAQSEKFAAELKTSAERLLDGAQVVRDDKDKTHLIVTTSTVKAYDEAKRLFGAMEKVVGKDASGNLGEAFDSQLAKAPPDTSRLLLCPMPGLITALSVAEGQAVKAGDPLAVVEAMKMENVLLAERDGVIAKILAKKGDNLGRDDVILEFQ